MFLCLYTPMAPWPHGPIVLRLEGHVAPHDHMALQHYSPVFPMAMAPWSRIPMVPWPYAYLEPSMTNTRFLAILPVPIATWYHGRGLATQSAFIPTLHTLAAVTRKSVVEILVITAHQL